MGSDAICSLCRQSSLRLLVRDPKQTKPWNGTPPQHRSSRLWWAETNAVWQWYVTPAIYDTVCSKFCVTVKQAFVSLDSCRSSLEGGAHRMLTAVGHWISDCWLNIVCIHDDRRFLRSPHSFLKLLLLQYETQFSSQVSHWSGFLWLSTPGWY